MIRSESVVEVVVEVIVDVGMEAAVVLRGETDIGRASLPLRDEGRDVDTKDDDIGSEDDKEANEDEEDEKEGGDEPISASSL